ncbi:hypothetical protein DFH94DRAFT_684486 [Russula ochroleuca]|uniref:Uncharacterized protein n=1 Tax=Russula ochroleuca TaxID=152965 RepID=A0A9P5K165_9AGAM|nr:hypothetical protein DFH94DRAFT_684486 [Russula ochroleuca]
MPDSSGDTSASSPPPAPLAVTQNRGHILSPPLPSIQYPRVQPTDGVGRTDQLANSQNEHYVSAYYVRKDGAVSKELSKEDKAHQREMERSNAEVSAWILCENNRHCGSTRKDDKLPDKLKEGAQLSQLEGNSDTVSLFGLFFFQVPHESASTPAKRGHSRPKGSENKKSAVGTAASTAAGEKGKWDRPLKVRPTLMTVTPPDLITANVRPNWSLSWSTSCCDKGGCVKGKKVVKMQLRGLCSGFSLGTRDNCDLTDPWVASLSTVPLQASPSACRCDGRVTREDIRVCWFLAHDHNLSRTGSSRTKE